MKHHYVPIVYQNRFVNDRGLLWVYDRKKQAFGERHPKVICFEHDLYAAKPHGAPKDQRLESVVLAQVDGDCATGIRTLISPLCGLPSSHYVSSLVAHFVGLQYSRVPAMREFVTSMWQGGTEEIMRLTAVNEGRMQSVIDRYERKTGDKITVSAKSMVESIQRGGVKVVVSETPFLRYVFETAKLVADTVIGASWEVIRAPTGAGFVLCDTPVVVVPPQGVRQVGFLVPGTVTYVPLSRGACLRISNPRRYQRLRYRDMTRETVALINQNIAANSVRFIMSPAKQELETVVALSRCEAPYQTPSVTISRHMQDDEGSFTVATINPRNYFYLPDGRTP